MQDLTHLLLAARDGDHHALDAAIREGQGEVWRLALHLVGPGAADEVTQDTFVRAWRALPAFRGDSSGRTWLLAIARRACADHVRGEVRRRRLTGRLEARARLSGVSSTDAVEHHDLQALVAALPPSRRDAFVLTQVLGCSYEEAAEICDVPVGTIRSRVARARIDLVAAIRAAETG